MCVVLVDWVDTDRVARGLGAVCFWEETFHLCHTAETTLVA